MSAYGHIQRSHGSAPAPPLPTIWTQKLTDVEKSITLYHLTVESARRLPGLLEYLGTVFAKEVADGMTYPQEGEINQTMFEAYFFSADVFLGLIGTSESKLFKTVLDNSSTDHADEAAAKYSLLIEEQRDGQDWEDCVAGFYYVKPNYPGRSSHICNAGFVVCPVHRGKGFGSLLSQSYVHYAPLLGYEASVFNLVYVNNHASIRLWEKLGFTKAGRIPRAGRLRTKDGSGEEYVDAWVFYKSFIET